MAAAKGNTLIKQTQRIPHTARSGTCNNIERLVVVLYFFSCQNLVQLCCYLVRQWPISLKVAVQSPFDLSAGLTCES